MDDEDIRLPDDTQEILKQFLAERVQQEKDEFASEDWNLSQFWFVNIFVFTLN